MINEIKKLIIKTANQGLKQIQSNGSMPAGHNGPYKDKETPVRNTSHWLITFSKAYKVTKDLKYKLAVKKLASYLVSPQVRPDQASFHHRSSPHKDRCNGLIGQAWTIEALAEASRTLKNKKYINLATKVFLKHRFNSKLGLWHRLEINGKTLPLDATLNHQIWFATAGSFLSSQKAQSQIKLFLNKLPNHMTILDNGLIFHPIVSVWRRQTIWPRLKQIMFSTYNPKRVREKLIYKSTGYHAFNLYALSILKLKHPKQKLWQSSSFQKTLNYCFSSQHKKDLVGNKYGFPYNPVGFEMPLIVYTFSKLNKKHQNSLSTTWVKQQMKINLDKNPDPRVQTARTYELTRSLGVKFSL